MCILKCILKKLHRRKLIRNLMFAVLSLTLMMMIFNCQKDVLAILGTVIPTVHFRTTIFAILKVLSIVIPVHFAITDALLRAVAKTIADKIKSVKNSKTFLKA